jgi:hypothetical protein
VELVGMRLGCGNDGIFIVVFRVCHDRFITDLSYFRFTALGFINMDTSTLTTGEEFTTY